MGKSKGKIGGTNQDPRADAMGEAPWWMPEDLDEKAQRVADNMVDCLSPKQQMAILHQSPERMSAKAKTQIVRSLAMGLMESVDYRYELARSVLLKPLEALKIAGSFVPKTVEIEGEVKHHHAIVVPAPLEDEAWNQGQKVLGNTLEEGWGETSPWGRVQEAQVIEEN